MLDIAVKRLQNVSKDFENKDCHPKLDDLINMCKYSGTDTHWQTFCKKIQMRDKYRQNNITNIIPQIKEYMNAKV